MARLGRVEELLEKLRADPAAVTFAELVRVCRHYFPDERRGKGSHLIFRTGLIEQPLLVVQPRGRMAKEYQCRQVVSAIEKKGSSK